MKEKALIEQLQRGDSSAQRQFIDTYKDNVFRTCMGFVHNKADADDLTQEVFIKALQSIHNFRQDARLSSWLYRIATNLSLNYLRGQKRNRLFRRIGNMFSGQDNDTQAVEPESTGIENPEERLNQSEQQQALKQAMDNLPEKQRTAFILHKYEALSYAQIAETMQTSLSSVESLLHRARQNLQQSLHHFYKKNMP